MEMTTIILSGLSSPKFSKIKEEKLQVKKLKPNDFRSVPKSKKINNTEPKKLEPLSAEEIKKDLQKRREELKRNRVIKREDLRKNTYIHPKIDQSYFNWML